MVLERGREPYPLPYCLAIEIWHRLVYILNVERQGNLLVCVWSYIHYTKGYLAFLGIIHQALLLRIDINQLFNYYIQSYLSPTAQPQSDHLNNLIFIKRISAFCVFCAH